MMKQAQYGLTLIELLMTVAIVGLLASVALPSFSNMTSANQVSDVAEKIRQDLLFARSESIKQNKNVHLSITTGANWCYGFTDTSTSCSCSTANSCQINASEKAVKASEYKGLSLSTIGSIRNNAYFTPVRGVLVRNNSITITNSSITVSQNSNSATVKINALGRPSICSDSLVQFSKCL